MVAAAYPGAGVRDQASWPLVALLSCAVPWLGARPVRANGPAATVIVVIGAPGAPEYQPAFVEAARGFGHAAKTGGLRLVEVGVSTGGASDRDRLRELLAREVSSGATPLWLVLVGHGTFDGRDAKLNLRGPDVSSKDLAAWLQPIKRPVVVINTASASGPFIAHLTGPDRIIVTATRSGREQNATRLPRLLAAAIVDATADLDKDGQTSLLEAWLAASGRVRASFEEEGLLATEHALLDDNGDGKGTQATFFEGLRPAKKPQGDTSLDGARAHQIHLVPSPAERSLSPELLRRRDELEQKVARLRAQRDTLAADEYYRRLEPLALELARLYQR